MLSLERTPATEVLPGTVAVWADALWSGRRWYEDLDVDRITEAFRRLTATRTTWPVPQHLLDAMPDRPQSEYLALPHKVETDEDRAKAMRSIEDILDLMGVGKVKP